ncbi:MAG: glycosyltransferase [Chloroflexota bacterium]|nr:glycosyltransferase [Chloroflexota bacterium]
MQDQPTMDLCNKPLRILYAIMSYEPENIGNEVHEELVAHFQECGHQVEVLTFRTEGAEHRDQPRKTAAQITDTPDSTQSKIQNPKSKIPVHTLFFPRSNRRRRLLRGVVQRVFSYNYFLDLVFGLRHFLRERQGQYDVIHVEAAYPLGTALVLALDSSQEKPPLVVNLQGADVMNLPRYDYGYGRYRLARNLLRYTFKRVAAVRPNSYYTGELASKLGAKPEQTQVILRNIGSATYPPPNLDLVANKSEKAAELRARYGLNAGPILMAYSRLHPFKGVEFLVRAIPIIKAKYGPINLLVCGPSRSTPRYGDYRHYLEKLAQELGVQEEIIFTGRIDFAQSRDYLAAADLLIVPSIVEALNKVATEAAAVGTPSIITESTGIGRHAAEAGVALLVKPASENALASGIVELLEDPARRAAMGERGPAWSLQFTSPQVGDRLLALYYEAIKNHLAAKKSKQGNSFCYLAYPSSLTLKSANAIQTFSTVRELKRLAPKMSVLLPRLPGRKSAFSQVGASHLVRIPFNFFSNFPGIKRFPWSYVERTFFASEAISYLLWRRLTGRPCRAIYVRDVICAYWLVKFGRTLLGAKIIYEAHDLEARNPSRNQGKRLSAFLQQVDRTILSRADGVVSLTTAFKDFLSADGWREAKRPSTVIPDAYDSKLYQPLPQAECRKALGLSNEEFIVVYAGLTFAYRGLDRMVEAFDLFLKQSQAEARLCFVGGRPFEVEELRQVVQRAGLGSRVQLIGQTTQEQVNLWLNAASLTVIPDTVTDLTASPLKMFEYAAVGRPVLLPDLPALREILADQEAIYFERGNLTALTAALKWVYANPEQAAAKGKAACRKVEAYTYANRAKAILAFVERV